MWRHEKGKNEKGSVCERYARDTHPELMQLADERLFCSGCRQRNASAAEVRRSNRNATFQRHDRSWFDEWSIPRLWNSPRTVRDR